MENIKIGTYNNLTVCFDSASAPNLHMALIGRTGSGKSVEAQKILIELAKQGKTVVVFDAHSVVSDDQVFDTIKEEFNSFLHNVEVYDEGICCELFTPVIFGDGSSESPLDTVGSIVSVLKRTMTLGSRQQTVLRKAVTKVLNSGLYEKEGFAAISRVLEHDSSTIAGTVREKMFSLSAHNIFRSGKLFIEPGKINVIRLSKFDLETQVIVTEMVLSYLWRLANVSQFKKNELFLFVDEFQNLPCGKSCALGQILAEGRKFGVHLILATQQMESGAKSVVHQRLLQSGLILFFQPNVGQTSFIARLINPLGADEWSRVLRSLGKGEFVALGDLTVEGSSVRTPLKVGNYENKKAVSEEKTAWVNKPRGSVTLYC